MIRHIVQFTFAKEAEGKTAYENAIIAKEKLEALMDKIDVLKRVEVGINDPNANENNATLCLTCDFQSFEDLNTYIVHPEHVKVGEFMGKVRVSRSCVDYTIS